MNKYELLYEALQEKVNSGELTIETAEYLNDVAYEMYATEDIVDEDTLLEEAVEYIDYIYESIFTRKKSGKVEKKPITSGRTDPSEILRKLKNELSDLKKNDINNPNIPVLARRIKRIEDNIVANKGIYEPSSKGVSYA